MFVELDTLSDSPVVFVGGKLRHLHGRVALVDCRGSKLVAVTIYRKYVGLEVNGLADEISVSEYVLQELGCEPDDVEVSFHSDGLFVYGTLLPKYITPGGSIGFGWGGLDKYPWVRTVVRGYTLFYSGLPYAVKYSSGNLLGVTYLGVPDSVETRIDSVELGAGYTKVEREGVVVENFPIYPSLRVRLYEYEPISGTKIPTMLFGELFVCDDELYWYDRRSFFDVLEGNCGIVITAPHGGLYRPRDMKPISNREADENTFELAKTIISKLYELSDFKLVPNAVLGRIHRSIVDLNRYSTNPINRQYHEAIRKLASNYSRVILVDIHGMRNREGRDIEIGTLFGDTVHGDLELVECVRRVLIRHGLRVVVDKELIGHFTVSEHSRRENVYALQIEIGREQRLRRNIDGVAGALAIAILEAYEYLSNR